MVGNREIVTSPYKCTFCGALEISIYSLADGKQPSKIEIERGFYKGEDVHSNRGRPLKDESHPHDEDDER
jgi:hypothetical protein